jgi:HSP20 family protein
MPWDPLGDLRAWQERLDRLTSRQPDTWSPPIDVYETADRYVITAELPGLDRDQIELALEDTRLTLRGRRPDRVPASGDVVHYHQIERGHGPFSRTLDFAEKVATDRVTADLRDGVLTVTLPKVPAPPVRRIEVG